MYNPKVIDYFSNPRNMGELKDADAKAQGGNPLCGDVVKLYLKIDKDKIADIKFKAFGCGACLASTSALTEMVKGKKIADALKVTNEDIAAYLDGLPPQKMRCSNFSTDVLHEAISKYQKKNSN